MTDTRPLALVTGASSGIGFELAKLCAENGFNLIVAADMPEIETAADALRSTGVTVEALQVDLASRDGVDQLFALVGTRPVDYLLANAGHGLGRAFLDQDFDEIRHVIDTNITGTVYLIQLVTREMRARRPGQGADYRLDRRLHARFLLGGLQRQQGLHQQLLFRAAQRAQGFRRDGDLPDAGRDRHGFLRAGRRARHQGWARRRRTTRPMWRATVSTP